MLEKLIVLLLLVIPTFAHDIPKLRNAGPSAKITYGTLTLMIFYLGIDYVTDRNWPDLNELLNYLLHEPAKRIVETVKLPS